MIHLLHPTGSFSLLYHEIRPATRQNLPHFHQNLPNKKGHPSAEKCPKTHDHSFSDSSLTQRVNSSIRSTGKGGNATGFMATDISFTGLSSAATRLEDRLPHRLHRWISAHSPFLRTHTAMGSISPPQSAARSPGSMSRCKLWRQFGQWLRCSLPAP